MDGEHRGRQQHAVGAFSINDGDQNYKFTISTFSGGGGTDLDNLNRWFGTAWETSCQ